MTNTKHPVAFHCREYIRQLLLDLRKYLSERLHREIKSGDFERTDIDPKLKPLLELLGGIRTVLGQLSRLPKLGKHGGLLRRTESGVHRVLGWNWNSVV